MKVAAVGDLHGMRPSIPACDLLLLAGDYQFDYSFAHWLEMVGRDHVPIVAVAGNHDFLAQERPGDMYDLPWYYLCDETVTLVLPEGGRRRKVKIHGSPWTPTFLNWAFMKDDQELEEHWAMIPDDVDILVTHGPPYGILDRTFDGRHVGSRTLRDRVEALGRESLRLHVFGHIHEQGGRRAHLAGVTLANVSMVGKLYGPSNDIQVFDL